MAHVLRLPQIDLAAVIAQQNPQIDLKLQAYEISTRNFLKAVSNYKNRAITVITERRNNQAADKKKVSEKIQAVENETNHCKVKEIELVSGLEREQGERKESELAVVAFKRQLASIREKCALFDVEIEQFRAVKANLCREREKELLTVKAHAAHAFPELLACERRLHCVVEGIEKDQLLVRFSHLDKSDQGHEFGFVIDVSSRSYKVLTSTSLLPTLPILVNELNKSRDIYGFIKDMRGTFQKLQWGCFAGSSPQCGS